MKKASILMMFILMTSLTSAAYEMSEYVRGLKQESLDVVNALSSLGKVDLISLMSLITRLMVTVIIQDGKIRNYEENYMPKSRCHCGGGRTSNENTEIPQETEVYDFCDFTKDGKLGLADWAYVTDNFKYGANCSEEDCKGMDLNNDGILGIADWGAITDCKNKIFGS